MCGPEDNNSSKKEFEGMMGKGEQAFQIMSGGKPWTAFSSFLNYSLHGGNY